MSYRQDPYYNNGGYAGGYQQGSNPRMPNDGYRIPNRGPYSTQNPNIIGSAMGASSGRAADEDDNISLGSSVYSQPSVAGFTPSNNIDNMRYYQEQSLETTEPRRQSLLYNEYSDYPPPPSPFAASTNTHNSGTGLTAGSSQIGLPLIDQNENNYMPENMEGNRYQNTQPQLDVYNDFNNNYQNDEKYDEESRHDTLTGPDGAHDPNSYAMNIDYTDNRDFSGNGKAARQSMTGEHYVVPPKKRRCAFCSRKTCVIITFTTLVFLAAGMFFVWPRIPVVNFSSQPTALGDANITITPAVVNMQMGLQFELDNTENWLPYNFNSFDVNVFDAANLNSNNPIATGNKKGFSIPGRAKSTVSIPTSFYYTASAPTDSLLKSFVTACTQSPDNEQKTTLNFRAEVTMLIKGLDWVKKPEITVQLGELQCPFNIPRPTPGPAPGVDPTQPIAPPTDPAAQPAPGAAPATDPAAQPPAGQPAPGAAPATDPVAQPPAGQPAPGAAPATDPVAQPPAAQPAPGAAPATDPVAQPPAAQPAPAAPATDSAAQPAPGAAPPTTPATDPAPANGGP